MSTPLSRILFVEFHKSYINSKPDFHHSHSGLDIKHVTFFAFVK